MVCCVKCHKDGLGFYTDYAKIHNLTPTDFIKKKKENITKNQKLKKIVENIIEKI